MKVVHVTLRVTLILAALITVFIGINILLTAREVVFNGAEPQSAGAMLVLQLVAIVLFGLGFYFGGQWMEELSQKQHERVEQHRRWDEQARSTSALREETSQNTVNMRRVMGVLERAGLLEDEAATG